MSREVKFRGWDEIRKKMFNIDVLAISPCLWSCPDYGTHGASLAYQPHIKVMQYTGLKDKNGKEIYEGDIVKWGHLQGSEENPIRVAIVKMNPDIQFECINLNTSFEYGCFAHQNTQNALEVIGNIYENPELVKTAS